MRHLLDRRRGLGPDVKEDGETGLGSIPASEDGAPPPPVSSQRRNDRKKEMDQDEKKDRNRPTESTFCLWERITEARKETPMRLKMKKV
uniref:Uncharacterized protein n=1 Tax=Vespula pensylvanica TaxID=30213 RepID=A0A834PAR9_VESPE|nr:hypothetical protein H0235_002848 [Vespula pensylvanica]